MPLPEKVIQTSSCTTLLYDFVLQTGLGMGMGINGTAQYRGVTGWHPTHVAFGPEGLVARQHCLLLLIARMVMVILIMAMFMILLI